MAIEVNGNRVAYVRGETIGELLERMNYVFPMVVVQVNGEVVPEAEFVARKFSDGDRIDVIHLTSGG